MKKILAGIALFFIPLIARAQASDALGGLKTTAGAAGYSSTATPLPTIIGLVISVALGLVGTIFLILMIYAGILWMTARGNEDIAEKSKDMIRNAVIGLVIVAAAYSLTYFIINQIEGVASGSGPVNSTVNGNNVNDVLNNALNNS